jgi:hypothetical protein
LLVAVFGCAEPAGGRDSSTATASATEGAPSGGTESGEEDEDEGDAESSGDDGESSGGPNATEGGETGAPTSGDDTTGSDSGSAPAAVLFVNFDGVTLAGAADYQDDATADVTGIPDLEGTWEAHDPGRRGAVFEGLQDGFAAFGIEVTDTRPAGGDYAMLVVTSSPTPMPGVVGLGISDCGDASPNNVAIVFDDAAAFSTTQIINAALYQVGVGYGLNPVTDPGDAMHNYVVDEPLSFTDACLPVIEFAPCEPLTDACADGMQNSHAELDMRFGA